jgi:hypothetical protein
MKHLLAVTVTACLIAGCGENFDGRYPIDSISMRTEGGGHIELTNQTYPLNAWFEIEIGTCFRIHEGGVTSVYPRPTVVKTPLGFDALSDDPHGGGQYSWSFEKDEPDGACSLTLTYDGIHSLIMVSKGKERR